MVQEGSRKGFGRFRKVQEGSRMFKKVQEGSRTIKKVQKGSRRFKKVQNAQEGSRTHSRRINKAQLGTAF